LVNYKLTPNQDDAEYFFEVHEALTPLRGR